MMRKDAKEMRAYEMNIGWYHVQNQDGYRARSGKGGLTSFTSETCIIAPNRPSVPSQRRIHGSKHLKSKTRDPLLIFSGR